MECGCVYLLWFFCFVFSLYIFTSVSMALFKLEGIQGPASQAQHLTWTPLLQMTIWWLAGGGELGRLLLGVVDWEGSVTKSLFPPSVHISSLIGLYRS